MKKKVLFISIKIVTLIILVIYLINIFSVDLNFDNDWFPVNHNVQKGEASLYQYNKKNYCFSESEKNIISDRLKELNVFNNEIFEVSECGQLNISFAKNDYDSLGKLFLYSDSAFINLKKWFESEYHKDNIKISDTIISVLDEEGSILFLKDDDLDTFRIMYITELPYIYKISEIDTYSPLVKYFLELNQKNIKEK